MGSLRSIVVCKDALCTEASVLNAAVLNFNPVLVEISRRSSPTSLILSAERPPEPQKQSSAPQTQLAQQWQRFY